MIKQCENTNCPLPAKEYESSRSDQRFCSQKCRVEAWNIKKYQNGSTPTPVAITNARTPGEAATVLNYFLEIDGDFGRAMGQRREVPPNIMEAVQDVLGPLEGLCVADIIGYIFGESIVFEDEKYVVKY